MKKTFQALNILKFECRNRVVDGCVCNLNAVKDRNAVELMEIVAMAFLLLGSPPETILNELLFSAQKRREDLRQNQSVTGYFAEGKSFLHSSLVAERRGTEEAHSSGFCSGT